MCLAFPKEKDIMRVQCGLCGNKGGAMRPSNLSTDHFRVFQSQLAKEIGKVREIPKEYTLWELHQYADESLTLDQIIDHELAAQGFSRGTRRPRSDENYKYLKAGIKPAFPSVYTWCHLSCGLYMQYSK